MPSTETPNAIGDVALVREHERREPADPSPGLRWGRLRRRTIEGRRTVAHGAAARRAANAPPRAFKPGQHGATLIGRHLLEHVLEPRLPRPASAVRSARTTLRASLRDRRPRRSPSTPTRRTQPRASSPSSRPVSDGRDTAAFSAMRLARSGERRDQGQHPELRQRHVVQRPLDHPGPERERPDGRQLVRFRPQAVRHPYR